MHSLRRTGGGEPVELLRGAPGDRLLGDHGDQLVTVREGGGGVVLGLALLGERGRLALGAVEQVGEHRPRGALGHLVRRPGRRVVGDLACHRVGRVPFPAAGQRHVRAGGVAARADHRVRGVDRAALRRMHRARVAQRQINRDVAGRQLQRRPEPLAVGR